MSENITVNTLRTTSNKAAGDHTGAIVSHGGIYVDENIICRGNSRISGDLNVDGNIYCPSIYTIIGNAMKYVKNILPDKTESSMIGSYTAPWETIYCEKIKTANIETVNINSPTFQTDFQSTNIISDLNLVDAKTNCIYFKAGNSIIDIYCPVYHQWESIRTVTIAYDNSSTLHLTTSTVFLETGDNQKLELSYNCDLVPDGTIVTTFFIKNKISSKVNYKLKVFRFNKKYVYTSKKEMKCIKLYFDDKLVYFL